jgi:hypothetical protein
MRGWVKKLRRLIRPAVYLSHNWISRIGVVLTSTSAITLVLAYISQLLGYVFNPYMGIIIFMILPGIFILGLLLIPLGIYREFRQRRRRGMLPAQYPLVSFSGQEFRRTAEFVLVMTAINIPLFTFASYQGVTYMDSVNFCGTTCHTVMLPNTPLTCALSIPTWLAWNVISAPARRGLCARKFRAATKCWP